MNLQNAFTDKTRELFRECQACMVCDLARWDSLHHITGRGSNSPLNSAPVHNHGCHFEMSGKLHNMEGKLLAKTALYLMAIGYKPTTADLVFAYPHRNEYRKMLLPSEYRRFFGADLGDD
jgi:hypothetical protein